MTRRKPIVPGSRDFIAEARRADLEKADAERAAASAMLAALKEISEGGAAEDPGEGEWDSMDEANTAGLRSAAYEAAAIARAGIAAAANAGGVRGDLAWVIERDIHSRLHYWAGRAGNDWRSDHAEALRFSRREDAELMLTYHCDGVGRVVEHMWCAPMSKSDAMRAMEKAMGPRENPPHPMFRDHNCAYCSSGQKPCKQGNPSQCEYPHARND